MSTGKFIVIEGLDGSGKATQTKLICEKLKKKHKKVCQLSFPDYNEPSSALVRMYLNSEFGDSPDDVNVYAASSFYAVDRYASYKRFWKDKYEGGQTIVADRYTTSNAIYQLCRLDREDWDEYIEWVEDYEYGKLELPQPDLVVYLDMQVDVSQMLMQERYNGDDSKKDLHEKDVEFLKKCREAAMYSAKKLGWKVVNSSENGVPKPIEKINKAIEILIEQNVV